MNLLADIKLENLSSGLSLKAASIEKLSRNLLARALGRARKKSRELREQGHIAATSGGKKSEAARDLLLQSRDKAYQGNRFAQALARRDKKPVQVKGPMKKMAWASEETMNRLAKAKIYRELRGSTTGLSPELRSRAGHKAYKLEAEAVRRGDWKEAHRRKAQERLFDSDSLHATRKERLKAARIARLRWK